MRGRWSLAIAGVILILAGGLLAHLTQTSGGIRIQDVRFKGAKGNTMSALLYIPANATPQIPAPGILAVHGYINSRETQDGFAIEFARRGYVVLALDQTGHGYSDPPAFANGFGGPDGLTYLRSLEFVDKTNIGLEGHSMGGWTVLAAATAMPNDYKSMVLEGSSTGKPFAADGTPSWPRNVALVFAQIRGIFHPDVGRRSGPRCHPEPETVGHVRDTGTGRTGQGLWRYRPGNRAGALHPRHHPPGRAHFP
jgi:pimeloyl-ACP methyl ester carboxylesterase